MWRQRWAADQNGLQYHGLHRQQHMRPPLSTPASFCNVSARVEEDLIKCLNLSEEEESFLFPKNKMPKYK